MLEKLKLRAIARPIVRVNHRTASNTKRTLLNSGFATPQR